MMQQMLVENQSTAQLVTVRGMMQPQSPCFPACEAVDRICLINILHRAILGLLEEEGCRVPLVL